MLQGELLPVFHKPWECHADTSAFVREYLRHWRGNKDVLRARVTLSMAGNSRFIDAEVSSTAPLFDALTEKIAAHQAHLGLEDRLHPQSTAGALLAMIERVAAFGPVEENDRQISDEGVIDAMARIINKTIFK